MKILHSKRTFSVDPDSRGYQPVSRNVADSVWNWTSTFLIVPRRSAISGKWLWPFTFAHKAFKKEWIPIGVGLGISTEYIWVSNEEYTFVVLTCGSN